MVEEKEEVKWVPKPRDWEWIEKYLATLPRDVAEENRIKNLGNSPRETFDALRRHAAKMEKQNTADHDKKWRANIKKITGIDPYEEDGLDDMPELEEPHGE